MLQPRANPRLFGHATAEAAFRRAALSGRLPHAWLIAGPPGIGKATLAYRLARRVLGGAVDGEEMLLDDPGAALFRRIANGSEPDLFVLECKPHPRTGKPRREIAVDQVREVTAGLRETAFGQTGRVVVVDAADQLNTEAANAFLKLLEEPPPGVVLFLVCHAPGRVPRTLVSRCVRLHLLPLDGDAMRQALAAAGAGEPPSAGLLALAKGSPGRLLALEATGFLDHYAAVLASLAAGRASPQPLLEAAERLAGLAASAGSELAVELLRAIVERGAWLASRGRLDPPLVADEAGLLERLRGGLPLDRWLALWDKLQRLPFDLDQLNVDARQAFFLVLAAMAGRKAGRRAA